MRSRFKKSAGRVAGIILATLLSLLVTGCGRKPADLHRMAIRAEAEARRAFEKHEAEEASRAAARAENALSKLKHQAESGKLGGPDTETWLKEARAAADSARNYALLASEEQQCRKCLSGLKLKAYRAVRESVLSYSLAGLAAVADQAGKADTNSFSPTGGQFAALAWNLTEGIGGRASSTNGIPDWGGAATDLRAWSTNPPPSLGLFLTLAFAVSGFSDFALCEVELVDASRLAGTNARALYHLERCALFAVRGWDRTAERELEKAMRLAPEGWNGLGSPQGLALFHCWLADQAIRRHDYRQADLEIARVIRAWPDNPLAAFLTGEQLAANGEWVKAADSLEAKAAGTQNEWLARRLAQRAREIRDSKGNAAPLFSDPEFILEVAAHALGESAENSDVLKKLEQYLSDAKAFSKRLAEKLPGSGQ